MGDSAASILTFYTNHEDSSFPDNHPVEQVLYEKWTIHSKLKSPTYKHYIAQYLSSMGFGEVKINMRNSSRCDSMEFESSEYLTLFLLQYD